MDRVEARLWRSAHLPAEPDEGESDGEERDGDPNINQIARRGRQSGKQEGV